MKIKHILKVVAIAILCIGTLDAKGGGGFSSSSSSSRSSSSFSSGSSRSSGSSSWGSSSRSSGSSSSSWGSSSKSSSSSSAPSSSKSSWGWGSSSKSSSPAASNNSASSPTAKSSSSWFSKPQTSTRPQSSVDRQRYETAVKSGKTFQTRDSAVADFKATQASKYQNKFDREPTTRPDYIPQSYKASDGRSYNITFNNGGYGYWSGGGPGLGTWMMYDMMSDAIMMETMMHRNNYYVGNPPPVATTTVVREGSWGFGWFLLWSLLGIGAVVGLVAYLSSRSAYR